MSLPERCPGCGRPYSFRTTLKLRWLAIQYPQRRVAVVHVCGYVHREETKG
jgi:hypothetical protein